MPKPHQNHAKTIPKPIPKPYQNHTRPTAKPYRKHTKTIQKPYQNHAKTIPKPCQTHTKSIPKAYQTHTITTPKPHQNHTKTTAKPQPNHTKTIPNHARNIPQPYETHTNYAETMRELVPTFITLRTIIGNSVAKCNLYGDYLAKLWHKPGNFGSTFGSTASFASLAGATAPVKLQTNPSVRNFCQRSLP